MPTAIWPATLPQVPPVDGLREQSVDTMIRTAMEVGPAKVRGRYTEGIRLISVEMLFTVAELEIFDAFYHDDTLLGAEPFEWVHPRTSAPTVYRFMVPPGPYAPIVPDLWRVPLTLEIVPSLQE